MSQHDMNIANQGFPAFRADLNNALGALATTSAGATEPSTTFANQFWYDSTDNLLKMRNSDNDAWITLAYFDQTNDEWEVRSAVIQAVDSAGVKIKADDGTTGLTVEDDGTVEIEGALAPIGGITNLIRIQVITSSGTYTPSTDATKALVYATGGGGGGGGVDGQGGGTEGVGMSGAGGGTAIKLITSLAASYTVTIGGGGGGGASGDNNGANGGTTTFTDGASLTLTANGGEGGIGRNATSGSSHVGGTAGGTATGGDINLQGAYSGGMKIISGDIAAHPQSGGSFWGGSVVQTASSTSDSANGIDATVIGAGGCGAITRFVSTNRSGGDGADGAVVIYEYL